MIRSSRDCEGRRSVAGGVFTTLAMCVAVALGARYVCVHGPPPAPTAALLALLENPNIGAAGKTLTHLHDWMRWLLTRNCLTARMVLLRVL